MQGRINDYQPDILPELTRYRDDGCSVAPACLACPLPACRYDTKADPAIAARAKRNAAIREAHAAGITMADLSKQFGLSKRAIHRAVSGKR